MAKERKNHFELGKGGKGEEDITSLVVQPRGATGTSAQDRIGEEAVGLGGIAATSEGVNQVSSDFDAADYRPALRGVGLGSLDEAPKTASPFDVHKPKSESEAIARNQGMFLLKLAGRCNHPICQMRRAKGMELLGRPVEGRAFGSGVESTEKPIPSVVTEKTHYPKDPVTGKQSRKNAQKVKKYSPAPEGREEYESLSNALGQSGSHTIHADDFLEHHHDPEEIDAVLKNGMPWDV